MATRSAKCERSATYTFCCTAQSSRGARGCTALDAPFSWLDSRFDFRQIFKKLHPKKLKFDLRSPKADSRTRFRPQKSTLHRIESLKQHFRSIEPSQRFASSSARAKSLGRSNVSFGRSSERASERAIGRAHYLRRARNWRVGQNIAQAGFELSSLRAPRFERPKIASPHAKLLAEYYFGHARWRARRKSSTSPPGSPGSPGSPGLELIQMRRLASWQSWPNSADTSARARLPINLAG